MSAVRQELQAAMAKLKDGLKAIHSDRQYDFCDQGSYFSISESRRGVNRPVLHVFSSGDGESEALLTIRPVAEEFGESAKINIFGYGIPGGNLQRQIHKAICRTSLDDWERKALDNWALKNRGPIQQTYPYPDNA